MRARGASQCSSSCRQRRARAGLAPPVDKAAASPSRRATAGTLNAPRSGALARSPRRCRWPRKPGSDPARQPGRRNGIQREHAGPQAERRPRRITALHALYPAPAPRPDRMPAGRPACVGPLLPGQPPDSGVLPAKEREGTGLGAARWMPLYSALVAGLGAASATFFSLQDRGCFCKALCVPSQSRRICSRTRIHNRPTRLDRHTMGRNNPKFLQCVNPVAGRRAR